MSDRIERQQSHVEHSERVPTTERLAKALEEANAPAAMVKRAREGMYDDYKSPIATPLVQLVAEARAMRLHGIAQRAIDGEFDAQRWEADEWATSADGKETFQLFFGCSRKGGTDGNP